MGQFFTTASYAKKTLKRHLNKYEISEKVHEEREHAYIKVYNILFRIQKKSHFSGYLSHDESKICLWYVIKSF